MTISKEELNLLGERMNSVHCLVQKLENGIELEQDEYLLIYESLEIAREYFQSLEV